MAEALTSKFLFLFRRNFDDAIDDNEVTLVKFYAPWYVCLTIKILGGTLKPAKFACASNATRSLL